MLTIYTIGHSTHPIDEFIAMLRNNGVEQLIDIRTIPRSRHNPQFEQSALQKSLPEHGIDYLYLPELGGLRPKTANSLNLSWKNESFRNFADYMQTEAFSQAVEKLIGLAEQKTSAMMCAEAVPWRCHRSLVGDALLVRGVDVQNILSPTQTSPHSLTRFALTEGTRVTYPRAGEEGSTKD